MASIRYTNAVIITRWSNVIKPCDRTNKIRLINLIYLRQT